MGKYSLFLLLFVTTAFYSCKKQTEIKPEINVEQVIIELVKSNRIDINYKLSHLGYQETGVSYYKKSEPAKIIKVNAIRQDGVLKLSLQNLEVNTEYVFNVFFKQDNIEKNNTKAYEVKTLSKESANYALKINSASISYDEEGNFTTEIEGDNLNNLNLKELEIKVNSEKVSFGYPILVAGSKYKIVIQGKVNPTNGDKQISCIYQGKEVHFQSVPFKYEGERYFLTKTPTSLRGYFTSVFNNELYYFLEKEIFRWNGPEQKLVLVGNIQDYTLPPNSVGFQFDEQLFFRATAKTTWPNQNDLTDAYNHPEAYSYQVGTGKWTTFPFLSQIYPKKTRIFRSANYFVHKNELYLTYSLTDDQLAYPGTFIKTDNFLYRYNKATKKFDTATNLNTEIIHYHFNSINNQLYLIGLVPVYDQGLKLSATFTVFKVSDTFTLEEIYKGGTVTDPLTIIPKYTAVYDQKILIGISDQEFLLFDPSSKILSKVYLNNQPINTYFDGFFTYNNKLHLGTDLLFTSQKVYEISVIKSR